jgi:hypothetical protein
VLSLDLEPTDVRIAAGSRWNLKKEAVFNTAPFPLLMPLQVLSGREICIFEVVNRYRHSSEGKTQNSFKVWTTESLIIKVLYSSIHNVHFYFKS